MLRRSRRNVLTFFLSSITRKEVRKHILTKTKEAVAASKKFREQANILRNIREPAFQALFMKCSETEVLKKLLKQFRTFLESTNAESIPFDGASTGDVYNAYFAVQRHSKGGRTNGVSSRTPLC